MSTPAPAQPSRPPPAALGPDVPRHFWASRWVMLISLVLGAGFVYGGVRSIDLAGTERAGAITVLALGVLVLALVQVRITVTRERVRIQHLFFVRSYRIDQIDMVSHHETVRTRGGVAVDRIHTVLIRMRGGGEVTLRPARAEIEEVIEAIEAQRRPRLA